jgi:VTC domain
MSVGESQLACSYGDAARSFNRYELKYVVRTSRLPAIRAALVGRLEPDAHAVDGRYVLSSLYFDSPDLACFWSKIDGESERRKVRIRHYETRHHLTADAPVYVEIKQRRNRTTQKRRVRASYAEALALCAGQGLDRTDERDQRVSDEVRDLARRYELRPTAITSYQREAWEGGWMDRGVRVTFDTDMRSRTSQLDLTTKCPGVAMLSPGLSIVEMKVNDRIPRWLVRVVAQLDMQAQTISKYCTAVQVSPLLRLNEVRPIIIHRLPVSVATTDNQQELHP